MAAFLSGPCVTLSDRSISFVAATKTEVREACCKTSLELSASHVVELPPAAPETQTLCFPADVPLPCWRAARGVGVGLSNPHALCFANAVLQALAYTPGFADDCIEGIHRRSCFARLRGVTSKGTSVHQGSHKGPAPGLVASDKKAETHACGSFCAFCKLEQQVLAIHRKEEGAPNGGPCRGPRGWVPNQLAPYIRPFIWRAFRPGRQEDAHEFFRFLLDALMKAPTSPAAVALQQLQHQHQQHGKKEMKPEVALTSYFGRLFGCWLRSSVVCSDCGRASVRFESAIDIPLDIGGGGQGPLPGAHRGPGGPRWGATPKPCTLEKALSRFIAKETLSGCNAYMCSQCNKKVTASKQLQLFTTPRVLVFALKRFSVAFAKGCALPMKNHRAIAFPAKLNLLPYVAQDGVQAQQQLLQQQIQQQWEQLQQQPEQSPKLLPESERSPNSAASTTASSPSSSPPHSPCPTSLGVCVDPKATGAAAAAKESAVTQKSNLTSANRAGVMSAAPSYLYRLFAVVSHSGSSPSSGHYRAFVRAPKATSCTDSQDGGGGDTASWLAIDDELVSVVSEAAVLCRLQQEAYLLFYSKIPSKGEFQQQELMQRIKLQEKQQSNKQQLRNQQRPMQPETHSDELEEFESESGLDSMDEAEFITSEEEWSDDCSSNWSSNSDGCSSDCSSSCSAEPSSCDAALPFLRELTRVQRKQELTFSRRRRLLLTIRCHALLRSLQRVRRGTPARQQQRHARQHPTQDHHHLRLEPPTPVRQHKQQQQTRILSVMTEEMMLERKKAAAGRKQQFGCSAARSWEEDRLQSSADEVAAPSDQELFEKLQLLQQPLPSKRSRHDREYDLGRAKKVKNPLSNKIVGAATVISTQAGSDTGAFVVQQRAAFDALQQKGKKCRRGTMPPPSQKKKKSANKPGSRRCDTQFKDGPPGYNCGLGAAYQIAILGTARAGKRQLPLSAKTCVHGNYYCASKKAAFSPAGPGTSNCSCGNHWI
ncbi:uncharacterized protein LOC113147369 [Cyclospora cayetanensis]|uniref:ubiquitinyl hydrolase 1 n=1 Tax=Cyclospora cayetanensis TaxID=88456 RepID=A0A6P6S1E5_9EIME|nr:uncharacterized protein LOC113147369 [Cyclospora cayetanensis]